MGKKSVLISIQPKWAERILAGEKTIEVRKTYPKLEPPFRCYIYETLPKSGDWNEHNGKVVGEFTCDYIERYARIGTTGSPRTYYRKVEPGTFLAKDIDYKATCLAPNEFAAYGNGKIMYGWHISGLNVYDKPRELSEFTKPCPENHNCATCSWYFPGIQDYGRCEPPCCGFWESDDSMIARPPQSWCFVEVD